MAAEAERILYIVKADGAEETARAFNQVAEAMEKTDRLQKAMNDAQNTSAQNSRILGYRQEADAINNAATQSGKATEQTKKFADAKNTATVSSGQLKEKISAAGGAIGAFSQAVSAAVPGMGELNTVFGTAVRIIPQILGVLGGGGVGLAAGGLIAALTAFGSAASSAAKEQAKLNAEKEKAKSVDDAQAERLRNYQTAQDAIAVTEQQLGANRLRAALALKVLNEAVGVDAVTAYQKEREAIDQSNKELSTRMKTLQTQAEFERKQRDETASFATASTSEAAKKRQQDLFLEAYNASGGKSQSIDLGAATEPGKKKDKWDTNDTFTADQANRELLKKLDDAQFDNEMKHFKEKSDAQYAQTKQSIEWQFEESAFVEELAEKKHKFDDEEYDRKLKQIQADQQYRTKMASNFQFIGNLGASVTAKLIIGAAEGQKQSSKAIMRTIGESMVGEGTKAIFSGIIDIASFNYASGGIKLATGAAEIAAGIGFGAAAGPAPSSSGGGAGAVSNPSPDQSPHRDNSGSDKPAPVQNIFIEFNSLTGPTAEDGLRVRESIRKADNVYGSQV